MDKAVEELQSEFKVLKNEIKETLSDIREHLLTNLENPFLHTGDTVASPVNEVAITVRTAPSDYNEVKPREVPNETLNESPDESPDEGPGLPSSVSDDTAPGIPPPQFQEEEGGGGTPPPPRQETAGSSEQSHLETEDSPVLEHNGRQSATRNHQDRAGQQMNENEAPLDLVTIAALVPWMEEGMNRIGQERMTAIVDLYGSIGGLTNDLSDVMHRLIALGGGPAEANDVTLRDCLHLIVELDTLVSRVRYDRPGAALLSMFLNGHDTEMPLPQEND